MQGRSQHFRADLGCSGADAAPTVSTLPIPRVDFLTEQVDHPCRPPCWRSISQRYSQAAARTRLRHYGAHRAACHHRRGVVMARSQGSSCLRGHLLLWPAPAPIRSLSCSPRLPCRPSSMNRCGASRDLRVRIMESAQNFFGSSYKIGYLPLTVSLFGWRTSRL
jgi:hypothetical protein